MVQKRVTSVKLAMEKLEHFLELGGTKKDITLLVISSIALIVSIFDLVPLPFDASWATIILCGIPIILEAVIGLVTAFDIKADVLVSLALIASVCIGEDFAAGIEKLAHIRAYQAAQHAAVVMVSHSMEDIAKYANRVLVMSNKKIAMYDTVEKVFARAPELLELGLSVPQVTKIFLKLREMGVDVPADVYTIPYAVKTLLEAKRRRDAGESLVLPRSTARKGGAV